MSWIQIFAGDYEQETSVSGKKVPIPPDHWPAEELLEFSALVVSAQSTKAKASWNLAGNLYILHSIFPDVRVQSDRLPILLNQDAVYITIPPWANQYSLKIEFPEWLEQVKVKIFAEILQ